VLDGDCCGPCHDAALEGTARPRHGRCGAPAAPEAGVASLAFSPDGRTLAAGDNGGQVTLWDVASGRRLRLEALGFRVGEVAFSRGEKTRAVGDDLGMIRLWPWRRLERDEDRAAEPHPAWCRVRPTPGRFVNTSPSNPGPG
jgi:WD40 repeat protein